MILPRGDKSGGEEFIHCSIYEEILSNVNILVNMCMLMWNRGHLNWYYTMWLFLFHDRPLATCYTVISLHEVGQAAVPPLILWSKPPQVCKRPRHGTTPPLNVLFPFNWMPLLSENHLLCHMSRWLWCCVSGAAGGGGYGVKFPLTHTHRHTHTDRPHHRLSSARHRQYPAVFPLSMR